MNIRKLTQEESEIYAGAVSLAIDVVPSFRDVLYLLRPFMNEGGETTSVDRDARVQLFPGFFTATKARRVGYILHEAMHVLNSHFDRFEGMPGTPIELNITSDMEINTTLELINKKSVDLDNGVFPDRAPFDFPKLKSFEIYHKLYWEQKQENDTDSCPMCGKSERGDQDSQSGVEGDSAQSGVEGDNSQGSVGESPSTQSGQGSGSGQGDSTEGDQGTSRSSQGQGNAESSDSGDGSEEGGSCPMCDGQGGGAPEVCAPMTDEIVNGADEAGIERASGTEKSLARKSTLRRVVDEKNSGGYSPDGSMKEFLDIMSEMLAEPKADWRTILNNAVVRASDAISRGRSDYSYRRRNRRFADSELIMPGLISYKPTISLIVDTSGSMGDEDYQQVLAEAEGILKNVSSGARGIDVICLDTEISSIKSVNSIKDIDFVGGGGTDMAPAFRHFEEKPKSAPDIAVLATDGAFSWSETIDLIARNKRRFKTVVVVTQEVNSDLLDELRSHATVVEAYD